MPIEIDTPETDFASSIDKKMNECVEAAREEHKFAPGDALTANFNGLSISVNATVKNVTADASVPSYTTIREYHANGAWQTQRHSGGQDEVSMEQSKDAARDTVECVKGVLGPTR